MKFVPGIELGLPTMSSLGRSEIQREKLNFAPWIRTRDACIRCEYLFGLSKPDTFLPHKAEDDGKIPVGGTNQPIPIKVTSTNNRQIRANIKFCFWKLVILS
jgi:hypothetical protein